MVHCRCFPATDCRTWSQVIPLLCLLGSRSSVASSTSTKSSLPADIEDDAFTFTEPGRSFVEYLQPPLSPANSKPEVDRVVGIESDFKTLVGSASLLHRDPRRRPGNDVINSSPETVAAAAHHVTGCMREAEIRVQLKIGMLHVSVTYDEEHVVSVSVGQGTCNSRSCASPFKASCSKLLLFQGFSAILV